MGRRLNTFVHIDGQVYGPSSDVPDEVAERITNPKVWDDGELPDADDTPAKAPPKRRGRLVAG